VIVVVLLLVFVVVCLMCLVFVWVSTLVFWFWVVVVCLLCDFVYIIFGYFGCYFVLVCYVGRLSVLSGVLLCWCLCVGVCFGFVYSRCLRLMFV